METIYVRLIRKNAMTIDEVPKCFREEVKRILEEYEEDDK